MCGIFVCANTGRPVFFAVKRSHGDVAAAAAGEERVRDNGAIYGQPTAIKRGRISFSKL